MNLGEAFFGQKLWGYFLYRTRWATIFLAVQLTSHVIEVSFYQQFFDFSFFGRLLLVKTLSYWAQDAWWWALEPYRRELREAGESNLRAWWAIRRTALLRPLFATVGLLLVTAAVLFARGLVRNEMILAPHLLFIPVYLIVLALQLVYQTALSLLQANRRVYRIPALFLIPDLLFFIVPLLALNRPQPWTLFWLFFISRIAQFVLSAIFLAKAYAALPTKVQVKTSVILPVRPVRPDYGLALRLSLLGPTGLMTLLLLVAHRVHWHEDFYSVFAFSLPLFNRSARLSDPLLFDLIRLDRAGLERFADSYLRSLGRFLVPYLALLSVFVGAISWWSLRDFNAASVVTIALIGLLLWMGYARLRLYRYAIRPRKLEGSDGVNLRLIRKSATLVHALRLYAALRGFEFRNRAVDKFTLRFSAPLSAVKKDITFLGAGLIRISDLSPEARQHPTLEQLPTICSAAPNTEAWHGRAWAALQRFDQLALKRLRVGPLYLERKNDARGNTSQARLERPTKPETPA